jgi:thiol-disulfide isomerase/thioredoxin
MLTTPTTGHMGRFIPLVAGLLLAALVATSAARADGKRPPPTVQEMLALKPKQDVVYTIPEPDKVNSLKVEKVTGRKGGSGWILKDADGKTLRLFFDTNDDDKVDVWSYFKDGVEVYREIDSTFSGRPDQYRWLNSGGSKWGIDEAKEFRIKSWKVISPEEVSQEILAALATHDFARLQTLMINDAEIKALDLPAAEGSRIQAAQKEAKTKFDEAVAKLTMLTPKAAWQYLQTDVPQLLPANQTGSRVDLVKHTRGTIVFTPEKGDIGMVQTGELVQVGTAWRIVSAPVAGAESPQEAPKTGAENIASNPQVEKLIKELTDHDNQMPKGEGGQSSALVQHFLKRADILEKIIGIVEEKEREAFIRQLADSLSSAAQSSKTLAEAEGLKRLVTLEKLLGERMSGSVLTAYVTYREMQAEYTLKLADPKGDFNKIQQEWLDRLTNFVKTYPKGEDTPDAILQAGQACEFPLNKDVEAKNWYLQVKKNHADKPQATKATGAIRRLESEGQPFTLAGPTLNDPNVTFDVEKLRGKVVVVYYWASWNTQSLGDFAKLNLLLQAQGKNGVELVAVNLDATAEEAKQFLAKSPAPGTHLHLDGGLESKLATDYGILSPPTFFLVGKDGKVVSHTVQINNLEEEVRKLLK